MNNDPTPEQKRRNDIYSEAMRLLHGTRDDHVVNDAAIAEFMNRSPLHAQYMRDLIGKPKYWKELDDYKEKEGWACWDHPPEVI